MRPDFSSDDIQRSVGILRTNGSRLESPPGHAKGLGLFPTYSMVNHSCVYNAITKKKCIDGVTNFTSRAIRIDNNGYLVSTARFYAAYYTSN